VSITININPGTEAALKQKADGAGISIEEYARQMLERLVDAPSLRQQKFQEFLRLIETQRGKVGPTPENALDPELMYPDR